MKESPVSSDSSKDHRLHDVDDDNDVYEVVNDLLAKCHEIQENVPIDLREVLQFLSACLIW